MSTQHFGREGWKTVRAAIESWGNTVRFLVIIFVAFSVIPITFALVSAWVSTLVF